MEAANWTIRSTIPILLTFDVEGICGWYRETFGWEVWLYPQGGPVVFGGIVIDQGLELFFKLKEPSTILAAGSEIYLRVRGLTSLFELIRDKAQVVESPRSQPWNETEFVVLDPDGNRLIFSEQAS